MLYTVFVLNFFGFDLSIHKFIFVIFFLLLFCFSPWKQEKMQGRARIHCNQCLSASGVGNINGYPVYFSVCRLGIAYTLLQGAFARFVYFSQETPKPALNLNFMASLCITHAHCTDGLSVGLLLNTLSFSISLLFISFWRWDEWFFSLPATFYQDKTFTFLKDCLWPESRKRAWSLCF